METKYINPNIKNGYVSQIKALMKENLIKKTNKLEVGVDLTMP